MLLFTDKEAAPPLFAALSVNLRARKLLFADVHASQKAVMEQFGVTQVRPAASRQAQLRYLPLLQACLSWCCLRAPLAYLWKIREICQTICIVRVCSK